MANILQATMANIYCKIRCVMQQKQNTISKQSTKALLTITICCSELIWNIAVYGYIPFGISFQLLFSENDWLEGFYTELFQCWSEMLEM